MDHKYRPCINTQNKKNWSEKQLNYTLALFNTSSPRTEIDTLAHVATLKLYHNRSIEFGDRGQLCNYTYTTHSLYPPQTLFVGGILFSRCPCVRPSVTLCFLNNSKTHCWIFIKPCKHVHICKTNTLDKKVRARGQFY